MYGKPFSVGSWLPGPGMDMITVLIHFKYVQVIMSKLPTVRGYNGASNSGRKSLPLTAVTDLWFIH